MSDIKELKTNKNENQNAVYIVFYLHDEINTV